MPYAKFPFSFINKGWQARYVLDVPPDPHTYLNLTNIQSREENTLSSKYGTDSITNDGTNNTPLPDANVHTLTRLKSINQVYRYAGAGTNLYRRAGDSNGAYTKINGSAALSGNRFTSATYRPNFSSTPFIFFADQAQMLKDNGLLNPAERWGGYAPETPPTGMLGSPLIDTINLCEDHTLWTPANFNGALTDNVVVNTTLGTAVTAAGAIATVSPASMNNILPDMMLQIGGGSPETVFVIDIGATTFSAFFANTHLAADTVTDNAVGGTIPNGAPVTTQQTSTMTATAIADLSVFPGGVQVTDNDIVSLFFLIDIPANLVEIQLLFDVGNFGDPIPFLSYYQANISPPSQTNTLANVSIPRGQFVAFGQAGQLTHDWSSVKRVQVLFITQPNTTTNIQVDNIILFGNGPNSTGGVGYDYRITYFNINTGWESSPSSPWVQSLWLEPFQQAVFLSLPDYTLNPLNNDPQLTHVRIYRRGGTLPSNWYLIDQIPITQRTYLDETPDSIAVLGKILELDNDPPITSLLPTPVNTTFVGSFGPTPAGFNWTTIHVLDTTNMSAGQYITVDTGVNQELSIVVAVIDSSHFTAYLQIAHANTSPVTASVTVGKAVDICCNAFNQMWLAGDSNNPHVVYYSKINNPESFPPQNFIELGSPSDPVMALIPFNGQLYAFTLTTAYLILPAGTLGATVPYPSPTRCKHGLVGKFSWAATEGEIIYASYDGWYLFQAGEAGLLTEIIDWIPKGYLYGPVPPIDKTQWAQMIMAYANRETFVSYIDVNAVRRRAIWSSTYKRWRPDDEPSTAMFFEADTGTFVVAQNNGMIYRDGVGDFYSGGVVNGAVVKIPITINMQTNSDNQGLPNNPKVYNELTLDIDTANQPLNVSLLFDNQATPLALGPVTATGRNQVQLAINAGDGQESLNVALLITGQVTTAVTLYDAYLKAIVEAELRLTWDTFFTDLGTAEWKIAKQFYGVVNVPDPAGVTVNVYLENSVTPAFNFILPQTSGRVSVWIRLPAIKFKLIRFIGTSPTAFQLYADSFLEWKPAAQGKGYQHWAPAEEVKLN